MAAAACRKISGSPRPMRINGLCGSPPPPPARPTAPSRPAPPRRGEGDDTEIGMTKAAILIEPGKPLSIEDIVVADCGPHEVRIRTAACGLCHSDLHFIDGAYPHPLPAIPGHEAAGIVEAVGSEVHGQGRRRGRHLP